MYQKLHKKSEGFTIIEVLIVLAIAGLIMLIVFLAVPALQRNSRNTSRRNDVGRVGSTVSEFVSNNNGALPTSANVTAIRDAAGRLSQYDFTAEPTSLMIASGGTPAAISDINQIRIVTARKCGTGGAVTDSGASARSVAIQYAVESSSGVTAVCQEV